MNAGLNLLPILLIRGYRAFRRTVLSRVGPMCPYVPTCSTYGLIAYQRHGPLSATALTAWRLLRCNPLTRGGWDPVPPRRDGRADPPGTPVQEPPPPGACPAAHLPGHRPHPGHGA